MKSIFKVRNYRVILLLFGMVLTALWWMLASTPVSRAAATITVTSAADNGPGTLRQAINDAASGDTINFAIACAQCSSVTITLTSGELLINKSLTIEGPGANRLTVQRSTANGTAPFRIFEIVSGDLNVTLSGLTITKGLQIGTGGGIFFNGSGSLNLTDCTVSGNFASVGGGGIYNYLGTVSLTNSRISGNQTSVGGGIFNIGYLTITSCTIVGNTTTDGAGGGIYSEGTMTITGCTIAGNGTTDGGGGGIYLRGILNLISSTVSGNSANRGGGGTGDGGGIYNSNGTVNVTNSTISGNTATGVRGGGGIFIDGGLVTITSGTIAANNAIGAVAGGGGGISSLSGSLIARNTIIALNMADVPGPDLRGTLNSQGYNLIGNSAQAIITGNATGNQLNVNPMLGPLQDNGGPTFTRALLSGSPAIEAGDSFGVGTDQRGFARPVDSPAIANTSGGDGSDIGAYEVQADQLPGCNTVNLVVNNSNDSGTGSLRAVIANACAGSTISFDMSPGKVVSPINLTSGELLIDKSLTINGPGANLLTVRRSAGNFRIFDIQSLATLFVTISGLTITNGSSGAGGGISSPGHGTLNLVGCTISANSASFGGAIFHNDGSTLVITNSTISGNSGGGFGGGIFTQNGLVTITNTTISGNTTNSNDGGGGIYNSGGTLTITNATISDNHSTNGSGGGINNGSGTISVRNTIIALNTATSGGPDFFGALTSQGFNLIGNNSGAAITPAQFSDQIGTSGSPINPLRGTLQNNGGPTQTHALLTNSPAINNGNSSGSITDQRGFPRPVGIATVSGGDGSDIGAFEVQATPTPTTVQFSAALYVVGEGDQRVTLTVTRTGNTSGAASAGFVTSDNAGAQNCNVFNANASSRCDYLTSVGTVQFAAGETSKTFSVPIIDDSYAEGNETFTVSLNDVSGATLGTQSTTTVMIVDNETTTAPNSIDQSSFFVRQHYLDFLNREPDLSGLNFWVNNIESCNADANCRAVKRIDTSAAFFLSIEFQGTGYLIERIYKASYGDATAVSTFPNAHQISVPIVRLNEFLPDTQEIGRGVIIGQTGWETALENNKQAFTLEFVQRSRFTSAFPTSMTAAQFVDRLFLNAGVTPVGSSRTAAINEFGAATTTADLTARSRALRDVAEDSILNQQEFNRAFVLMQFLGYLRRNPNEAPDTDYTGYDFWLTKLNQFNGNYVSAEMVKAFILSGEYHQRFGP